MTCKNYVTASELRALLRGRSLKGRCNICVYVPVCVCVPVCVSLLSPPDPAHTVGLNSRIPPPPTPPHDPSPPRIRTRKQLRDLPLGRTTLAIALASYRIEKPRNPETATQIGRKYFLSIFCLFFPYFSLICCAYSCSYFLDFGVFLFCSWPTRLQNYPLKSARELDVSVSQRNNHQKLRYR